MSIWRFLPPASLRVLLVIFSLVLSLLSLPGGAWPLLSLVSLVPLGVALREASRAGCFVYAYVCAFLGWLGSTRGLIDGLSSYAHVSSAKASVLVVLACTWFALPYGAFGLLHATFQRRGGPIGAFKTAACLTVLVSFFPTPLPVDSSHALYRLPVFVQILDLGGQPLLLFTLYSINWLLVDVAWKIRQGGNYRASTALAVGICAFVSAYGCLRLAQFHGEEAHRTPDRALRVAMIQPNITLAGDSSPHSQGELNPFHTLLDQSAGLLSEDHSIELVVWPETPTRISCDDESEIKPELTGVADRYTVPFLINCVEPAPGGRNYNTELLATGRGRTLVYRKQKLFPFTEYIPGEVWFPNLRGLLPGASRYAAGSEASVFPIKASLAAFPAICYEILFPNRTRQFLERGGNILISPANDAWFETSRIPDFQIAECVYQAIQHRIPVVRVANSGNSIAVRATGEIVPGSRTPVFTKTTRVVDVFAPRARAPYFYIGNWFLHVLTFCWLVSVLLDFFKGRGSQTRQQC